MWNHACDDTTTVTSDDNDIYSNKSDSYNIEFVSENEKFGKLVCCMSESFEGHKEKLYRCKSCML